MNTKLRDKIVDLAKDQRYLTNQEIGDTVGCSEASVRRVFKVVPDPRVIHIDYDLGITLDTPVNVALEGGVMIAADWHIPLYDKYWVNHMLDTAIKNNIKKLILAGDLMNFDSLSMYDPKQLSAGLQLELSEGKKICTMLDQLFDEVVYIWGNHDARFMKSLGHKIGFADSMKAILPNVPSFRFSNLDHCIINMDNGLPWYVCHPRSYNSVPLTSAIKLANKYNANVITAHSHHLSMGFGTDGNKRVVEAGGLFNAKTTAYLQASTAFPTWTNGFVYITEDGTANVIGDGMHGRI